MGLDTDSHNMTLPWDCWDQKCNKIITKYESLIDNDLGKMVSWCVKPEVVLLN